MLVAHDAVITNSRKAQHKLGKLVNQGRHPAHKAPVDQLPETVRPPGSEDPLGGSETRGLRQGSIQEAKGATACLRVRPTDSFRFIHASQFVGIGRRFMGIEEHAAARCPCCDAVDVDTRHARICPGAVAHVNQHHPLLHAISRTLKRLGVSHQVESGEHFTADRNLRMDIGVRRGGLRDAPNREYREKPILLGVTHADLQAQAHLRGSSAGHDGSTASTPEAYKRQHYARPGHVYFDERSHKLATIAVESFGRLGVEGSAFIDQLTTSVVGGRNRGSMTRKGVVKERLLQIVSVTAQVAISQRVSRLKLQLRDRQEAKRSRGGNDRPRPVAWG